ncbi:MAG: fatty acid--CoA ligase family protein [Lapillicoccus sp.]
MGAHQRGARAVRRTRAPPGRGDARVDPCSAFAYVSQVLIAQTLVGGGSVTLRDRFNPAVLLRVVEDEGITQLSLVEPLLAEFADHPDLANRDLSSLTRVSHIGANAPASFRTRLLARLGPILVNTYGASEAGMVSVLAAPDYSLDHPERLGTAGRPRPGVDVRIVTADGATASHDEPGVVEVRLPGMSSGYVGRPDDPAFHDGWYTTGDLGYLDADGYLHIRGRAADARRGAGVTVLPLDLEDVACTHPDVVYAVALPASEGPEGCWGCWPCALADRRSPPLRCATTCVATSSRRPPSGPWSSSTTCLSPSIASRTGPSSASCCGPDVHRRRLVR